MSSGPSKEALERSRRTPAERTLEREGPEGLAKLRQRLARARAILGLGGGGQDR